MSYLLATNICVALIRRKSPRVAERLGQQVIGNVAISTITVAELAFGAEKSADPEQNRRWLDRFLLALVIVPFDRAATAAYGQIRASLERQGTPIGPLDLLIAAHALSLDYTFVTDNEREFARVPGLIVENWIRD